MGRAHEASPLTEIGIADASAVDYFRTRVAGIREGRSLTAEEADRMMELILSRGVADELLEAYLIGLGEKGETVAEIVGSAQALRRHAARFPRAPAAVDVCGTGGDGAGTFNISTASALVIAAAGQPVVKHGNRSATGRVGSADVLETLGIPIELSVEHAARCLRRYRFVFLFAPQYHPAMRRVAPVRRRLGIPTIFNLIGPLCNPANPGFQIIGVCSPSVATKMGAVLATLRVRRAFVVSGAGGVDEAIPGGANDIWEVREATVEHRNDESVNGDGIRPTNGALRGGDARTNAEIAWRIFSGEPGFAREVVILNAAYGLLVAGRAATLAEARDQARSAIDEGRVLRLVCDLRTEAGGAK